MFRALGCFRVLGLCGFQGSASSRVLGFFRVYRRNELSRFGVWVFVTGLLLSGLGVL